MLSAEVSTLLPVLFLSSFRHRAILSIRYPPSFRPYCLSIVHSASEQLRRGAISREEGIAPNVNASATYCSHAHRQTVLDTHESNRYHPSKYNSSIPQFFLNQVRHHHSPATPVMDIIPSFLGRSASTSQCSNRLLSIQPGRTPKNRVFSLTISPTSSSSLPPAPNGSHVSNVAGTTTRNPDLDFVAHMNPRSRRNSTEQSSGDHNSQERESMMLASHNNHNHDHHHNNHSNHHHHHHHHRSKTHYRLALPPPRGRQRIRFRRKLLLQIQQLKPSSSPSASPVTTTAPHPQRPVPILDVLPASTLLHPHRLSKKRRLTGSLHGKNRTSPADVIVVPSDRYDIGTNISGSGPGRAAEEIDDSKSSMSSDDYHGLRTCEDREVCAAIFQPNKEEGLGQVILRKDIHWEVSKMGTGSYEFVRTHRDGSKSVARWILRTKKDSAAPGGSKRSSAHDPLHDSQASPPPKKFTFSIIDPTKRRHPVIAWLSRTGFEILDHYSPVSMYGGQNFGSRPTSNQRYDQESSSPRASPRSSIIGTEDLPIFEADESLRFFISVTAIYVALREDWTRNPISSHTDSIVASEHLSNLESSPGNGNGLNPKAPEQRKISQGRISSSAFPNLETGNHHSRPQTPQVNRDSFYSTPPLTRHGSGSVFTLDDYGGEGEGTDGRGRHAISIQPYPAPQPPQKGQTGEVTKGEREEPEEDRGANAEPVHRSNLRQHNDHHIINGSTRLQLPQRPLEVRILEPPDFHSRHHHQDGPQEHQQQQQSQRHTAFRRPPQLTASSVSSLSSADSPVESHFSAGNRGQDNHNHRPSHGTVEAQVQHPQNPNHHDHTKSGTRSFSSALRNSIRRPKKKYDSLVSNPPSPSPAFVDGQRGFGGVAEHRPHHWRKLSSWLGIESLKRKMKHSDR